MAQVPYPLTADSTQDLKVQVWELIRELYEEKIAGLSIGDVFSDDGDVMTLNLTSLSCLEKIGAGLSVKVADDYGIFLSSDGLAIKCKAASGITVSADGLELDSTVGLASTLFNANTILKADADNTPVALAVATNRIVGRAAGTITALTGAETRGVVLSEQAHIADGKTDYTTGDLDSEAKIITAVNAINTKLNAILAALEANDILAIA